MFPIGAKKIAMTRMKEISKIVRESRNMLDPEIMAMMSEWHDLAKEHDLYRWAEATKYED